MSAHGGSQPGVLLARRTSVPAALPDWHELSAALGRPNAPAGGFVTRLASAFVKLHWTRQTEPDRIAEVDSRREGLVIVVDNWVANRLSRVQSPDIEKRSIGEALDKLAAARVAAEVALDGVADGDLDEHVHAMWFRLGSLLARWTHLRDYVVDGQPFPWPPDSPDTEL
jgi:hypothetical protein